MLQIQPQRLSPLVQRLRASNPGPMTLTGTNSYLIGTGPALLVLDPGPLIESHLQSLVEAANSQAARIEMIAVTHGHPDHYPGAARLHELTGAPVVAYREATYPHQIDLEDGQSLTCGEVSLQAIFTPGHAVDHLCFYLAAEQALFTGDNILGTGTTIVAPPKGDMAAYLASLRRLQAADLAAKVIYGGHGPEITDPATKIQEYLLHRQARQQKLTDALAKSPLTIPQLVEQIYQDVDRRLWPAAARQVLAYLIMLENQGQVRSAELPATQTRPLDEEIMFPDGGAVDPVAAAELGIDQKDTSRLKLYTLLK